MTHMYPNIDDPSNIFFVFPLHNVPQMIPLLIFVVDRSCDRQKSNRIYIIKPRRQTHHRNEIIKSTSAPTGNNHSNPCAIHLMDSTRQSHNQTSPEFGGGGGGSSHAQRNCCVEFFIFWTKHIYSYICFLV